MSDGFPDFPPGPRWFLGLRILPRSPLGKPLGIRLVEGTDETDISEIAKGGPSVIYVFGTKVTIEEVAPAIHAMFTNTGPTVRTVFHDKLAGVYLPVALPIIEGEQ